MKSFRIALVTVIAIVFAGCPVRSIFPLFTDQDAVLNPALIGTWEADDETYTFEKLKEKNYQLVIRSKKESDSTTYVVWLGKIGSHWFLDSYPIVNSDEHHYMSVHVFTRMKLEGDTLRLASLEADWISKMIDEKKIKITHVRRENEVILTASTKELQQLMGTIANNREAFPDENAFVRIK
ncbi:MAG: hypothetical protein HYV29_05485 [Ignavibacteriales bacterium]|nr:hypothetical protein [Ignavibacteriales bacterium]